MSRTKLTHAQLAAAHERGDWAMLWQQAMPLVKLVIKRMRKDGTAQSDNADDDGELLQQGMLIAGEAMRGWKPLECTFSTWIANRVRSDLLNDVAESRNGGVASYKQNPLVLSLGDDRPDAQTNEEEEDNDGTFEAALTYAGVVMRGGQHDGNGYVPRGFGDPSEEADVGARTALRAALQHLNDDELLLVSTVYGLSGGQPQTLAEFAEAWQIPYITAKRRWASAKAILSQHLENFRNS